MNIKVAAIIILVMSAILLALTLFLVLNPEYMEMLKESSLLAFEKLTPQE